MGSRQTLENLRKQMQAIVERDAPAPARSTQPESSGREPRSRDARSTDAGRTADGPAGSTDEPRAALNKIIALVNVSDRSEKAIRNRLISAGFSESAIEQSVSSAKDYGFINDARFADVLIRSRIAQARGSAGIERELVENGIDPTDVEGWPFDYDVDDESETQRALGVLRKKPPRAKNKRDAAYRRLMQKGYPSSVSASAARQWCEECEHIL